MYGSGTIRYIVLDDYCRVIKSEVFTMSTVDNFISNIYAEDRTSKAGKPFKLWYAELDDGRKLKFGFNKPKYAVGQRLVGHATTNKFGDLEFSDTAGGAAPSTSTSASTPAAANTGRRFPVPATSPETSIIRQNALTNANTAVHHYMERNAGEVNEPSSVEEYADMVIEIAYKFADFSSGQREVKRVTHMMDGSDGSE